MKRYLLSSVILAMLAILMFLFGCSEDVFLNEPKANIPPEVWLSSGPVEGITTGYQVHFYWGGWDPDGEIAYYEFKVVDAYPFGYNPEDLEGEWPRTASHDSIFKVSADDSTATVIYNNNQYTYFDRMHTFFLRAVDLQGERSEPASRSFTAWTLAPYVEIDRPPLNDVYSLVIKFGWTGYDPIDAPGNTQDPESVRYMYGHLVDTNGNYNPSFDILKDLNRNPQHYQDWWRDWVAYDAPEDSGRTVVIPDEKDVLITGDYHIFAVQAKDEAGAVTGIFSEATNFRKFIVSETAVPTLYVTEDFIGTYVFLGRNFRPIKRDLPPGVPLNFRWRASAYEYGGEITGYRYGWDIADVNNPGDWPVQFSPYHRAAPEAAIYSGVHTFFVEVKDNSEFTTLAQIQINVIPFTMERNLLWVDDFYSVNFVQKDYVMPTENEHDAFWLGICSRAEGFDPEVDVYDATLKNFRPAPITTIGKYKNIIWTYSAALSQSTWQQIVNFTPETSLQEGTQLAVNYIALFLAKGGHVWTLGRSDSWGGLAATLTSAAFMFPMSLRCEIAGNEEGCETDTSGVNSMGYKDYCITMLDKISAPIRQDEAMPRRQINRYDVMMYAVRADGDPITAAHPEIPAQLDLWETAVAPGTFFYVFNESGPGGFTYVETYDPEYWMAEKYAESQSCFHPMFRMKAYNARSALNNTTVAIWLTKYQDIKPDILPEYPEGYAAPSFHFGFPLWFFNREQGSMLVDLILDKWHILKE